MSRHALDVWDADVKVGTVAWDSLDDRFDFDYSPGWASRETAYPVSPQIPLRGEAPNSSTVKRFIENLLPEGRALDIVATTHRVAKNNIFGLIRELGRESAGALAFVPEGESPSNRPEKLREVSHSELARRIEERALVPFALWDGRVRLSIAGFQDKLPAFLDGDRIFLAEGALASTHILKPEPADARVAMLVANEHFCMSLTRALGVPVATVRILRVPNPVLVVERFDRAREAERVRRIHIIDACQALDLPVSYKYERNLGSGRDVRQIRDGVSFPRLFSVNDFVTQKAVTAQAFTRWAIAQYLVGNTDAHGKNISFFSQPHGLSLASFYDIVSTVQYPDLDHELAMAFGDEFALEAVSPYAWADFAHRVNVPRQALVREMRRMAGVAQKQAPRLAAAPDYVGEERDVVVRISDFVRSQAAKLIEMTPPTLGVDSKSLE